MEFFPSPKVFLQIGPFSIAWYAICIMIGGIFGCSFSARELKKNGYSTETIEDLFMGTKYYYQVIAQFENKTVKSQIFSFETSYLPRTIDVEGISNTRDAGGYTR